MGFRFRRSIRLFPGVRVNLSKGAPSVSVGERGHTVNVSERGTRATVGLPGSGVSYTTPTSRRSIPWLWLIVLAIVVGAFWTGARADTNTPWVISGFGQVKG